MTTWEFNILTFAVMAWLCVCALTTLRKPPSRPDRLPPVITRDRLEEMFKSRRHNVRNHLGQFTKVQP